MKVWSINKQRGVALITVLVLLVGMMGVSGSALIVLTTRAKAVRDGTEEVSAFYMAEAGLEASKYELATSDDAAKDGVGKVSLQVASGNYSVSAKDLGSGLWKITSVGESGERSVTLEAIVNRTLTSRWPSAAISIIGDIDQTKWRFKSRSKVNIDGEDRPALLVSSPTFYKKLGTDLATDVVKRKLKAESLNGDPTKSFLPKNANKKKIRLPSAITKFLRKQQGKKQGNKIARGLVAGTIDADQYAKNIPANLKSKYKKWLAKKKAYTNGVDLPIGLQQDYASALADLTDTYDALVKQVQTVLLEDGEVTTIETRNDLKKKPCQLIFAPLRTTSF